MGSRPVCQYFLKGACKYGDRCKNEHPQQAPARSLLTPSAAGWGSPPAPSPFAPASTPSFGRSPFAPAAPSSPFAPSPAPFGRSPFAAPAAGPQLSWGVGATVGASKGPGPAAPAAPAGFFAAARQNPPPVAAVAPAAGFGGGSPLGWGGSAGAAPSGPGGFMPPNAAPQSFGSSPQRFGSSPSAMPPPAPASPGLFSAVPPSSQPSFNVPVGPTATPFGAAGPQPQGIWAVASAPAPVAIGVSAVPQGSVAAASPLAAPPAALVDTPLDKLTPAELEAYRAREFDWGAIPETPPPLSMT